MLIYYSYCLLAFKLLVTRKEREAWFVYCYWLFTFSAAQMINMNLMASNAAYRIEIMLSVLALCRWYHFNFDEHELVVGTCFSTKRTSSNKIWTYFSLIKGASRNEIMILILMVRFKLAKTNAKYSWVWYVWCWSSLKKKGVQENEEHIILQDLS